MLQTGTLQNKNEYNVHYHDSKLCPGKTKYIELEEIYCEGHNFQCNLSVTKIALKSADKKCTKKAYKMMITHDGLLMQIAIDEFVVVF